MASICFAASILILSHLFTAGVLGIELHPEQQSIDGEMTTHVPVAEIDTVSIDDSCYQRYPKRIALINEELKNAATMAEMADEAFNAGPLAFQGLYAQAFWPNLDT